MKRESNCQHLVRIVAYDTKHDEGVNEKTDPSMLTGFSLAQLDRVVVCS